MPDGHRQRLAQLAAHYEIPVIEDDAYGDLHFIGERPRPVKAFDTAGWVLHCGSMSKSLAPGYRVGWLAPGRFFRQVWESKVMTTVSTAAVCQETLLRYLKRGGFEQHLRRLRTALSVRREEMLRALAHDFPPGTRVSRPHGGFVVWVELPKCVNALELYRLARDAQVSIVPGPIFSAQRQYRNCIRLNFGYPTPIQIRRGVRILAQQLPAATNGATL
jgi:DNA-binding transcriptional MocR family regulator